MNNMQYYYNMDLVIEKDKYLDFNGLKKYDELIKSYIESGHKSLANASDVSALLIDVAALKSIDHDAYISADEKLETSLKGYIDNKMDSKQDVIEDLENIRSGAAAGSTALQTVPSEYITETELTNKEYTTTSQVVNLIDNAVITSTASDSDIDSLFTI